MTTSTAYFRRIIERLPPGTRTHASLLLGESPKHRVYYTPFGHVNPGARVVVVGITPGPEQMALALDEIRACAGLEDSQALARAKRHGAFGGSKVKPNLLRMLQHYRVAQSVGLGRAEDLWGSGWPLFQPTSVVPNAAFVRKADGTEHRFNGSFQDVLDCPLLRSQFEQHFLPLLGQMAPDALWVGLGPTPTAALNWLVRQGRLRIDQVVPFAHPSTAGGSQVDYFLGLRGPESFKPRDPVRNRLAWLDQARAQANMTMVPRFKESVRARDIARVEAVGVAA